MFYLRRSSIAEHCVLRGSAAPGAAAMLAVPRHMALQRALSEHSRTWAAGQCTCDMVPAQHQAMA
jgi:hypothetical protein